MKKSSSAPCILFVCLLVLDCSSSGMAFLAANTVVRRGRTVWPWARAVVAHTRRNSNFEREIRQRQKAMSNQIGGGSPSSSSQSPAEHAEHQAKVFDELASFFASEAIPPEVVPILEEMTDTMIHQMIHRRNQGETRNRVSRPARVNSTDQYEANAYHILDVGCGAGALFDFYLRAAEARDVTLHIHGLDVTPKMVDKAAAYGRELLDQLDSDKKHSIAVELGDICDDTAASSRKEPFCDLAVANACFGNFWDQTKALQGMANALRLDGLLCVTHPLGSDFVRRLHQDDPKMVPHLLPTLSEFQQLSRTLPLQVLDVVDKDESSYYQASAAKVVYRTLPQTIQLRGQVDSGYGRGGKKLGFPTANLPSRLFQGALQDIACGVYFGWAVLEGTTAGRNIPHKAVVNVGYSPTFEGQENPEKIVEAHLMFPKDQPSPLDPPDFYGEVMRLQLIGFIRPEMKFPSFPALIAQISTDVEDAKDALDLEFFQSYQKDSFLSSMDGAWVGRGGGDMTASWEFEDVELVLDRLRTERQ